MSTEKEQWINQVMNSLDNSEKAEPQPFLFRKIMNKVEEKKAMEKPVARRTIWQTAAALCLLILFNVLGATAYQEDPGTENQIETVAEEYELTETEDFYISYFE